MFGTQNERTLARIRPIVDKVNSLEAPLLTLPDDRLVARIAEYKERAGNGEPLDDLLPEAFAVVREAGKRVLNMRHFDVQLVGRRRPPRGPDRRDADRRGQDARRDAARSS